MLSVSFFIVALAASVVCVPISSPGQASTGAISTLVKKQVTWTSYVCSDANDPSTCKVDKTWTEGEGGSTSGFDQSELNTNDQSTQPSKQQETTPAPDQSDSSQPNTNTQPTQSGDNSMLATINKWRSAYGLTALSWSQAMVDGAAETGQLNNGQGDGFQHHGRGNAEVMTPGNDNDMGKDLQGFTPFEIGYVAGWLCEVPSGPVANSCQFANSISPM
ncbi:MAG: hypothetical protein Q9207_008466 [Kuettlingeria erythrocarpa]